MVALNDDERNNAGHHKAEINGEVGGYGDEKPSLTTNVFALVGGFGATGTAGGIFT